MIHLLSIRRTIKQPLPLWKRLCCLCHGGTACGFVQKQKIDSINEAFSLAFFVDAFHAHADQNHNQQSLNVAFSTKDAIRLKMSHLNEKLDYIL